LSAAKSGFFIPEAVMGATAAARRRRSRGGRRQRRAGRGTEAAQGLGEWREEGDKRRRFGGKGGGSLGGNASGPRTSSGLRCCGLWSVGLQRVPDKPSRCCCFWVALFWLLFPCVDFPFVCPNNNLFTVEKNCPD